MKHSQTAVLLTVAVLFFAVGMSVSRPISAAERPSARATASGTPAATGGALFVELVSVLRQPRCMQCHSQRDFPRQGDDSRRHSMNGRRAPHAHVVTA